MSKSFPSDFYVTCATVIPVLFLALIVQGGTYEAMLKTSRHAAQTFPKRQRDYAATELFPAAAWLTVAAVVIGEAASLIALYNRAEDSGGRIVVLICVPILLFAVTALPVWNYFQTTGAIIRQQQAEKQLLSNTLDKSIEQFSEQSEGLVVEDKKTETALE